MRGYDFIWGRAEEKKDKKTEYSMTKYSDDPKWSVTENEIISRGLGFHITFENMLLFQLLVE